MSVMGFQQKSLDGGWVGGVNSIQFFLIFGILLTLHHPLSRWAGMRIPSEMSLIILIIMNWSARSEA